MKSAASDPKGSILRHNHFSVAETAALNEADALARAEQV